MGTTSSSAAGIVAAARRLARWAAITLSTALAAAPAGATILTFDQVRSAAAGNPVVPTFSGATLPLDYGDGVTGGAVAVPGGVFTYGEAGEGYTPQVQVEIYSGAASSLGAGVGLWVAGYGDLGNVLFGNNASRFLVVRLTAAPGGEVGLFGFDLAGWRNADHVIAGISVVGDGSTMFERTDVLVEGDAQGPRHSSFAFTGGLFARELMLMIDYANLPASQHDEIGLDNLRFGQGARALPEPGTLPLLAAGVLAAGFAAGSRRRRPRGALAIVMVLAGAMLAGCGGGGGDETVPAGPQVTRIGAAGGTAAGPGGSQASVPAGALAQQVDIGLEASDVGAPALPADATRVGTMYAFTPHGTTFAQPVTVTVPFDPALLPPGSTPVLYQTTAGRAGWAEVPGARISGAALVGSVSTFSNFVVVVPALIKTEARYEFDFSVYLGNGQGPVAVPTNGNQQIGGIVSRLVDLGPAPLDLGLNLLGQALPRDGRANGYVFAQGNGVTYGAFVDAPFGALNSSDPIGGRSRLKQWQTFEKVTDDARLTFTLTSVVLRLEDYVPRNRRNEVLVAEAELSVAAFLVDDRTKFFYQRAGRVTAWGERGNWDFRAPNYSFATGPLWDESMFELKVESAGYLSGMLLCNGEVANVRLKQPRTYTVDLSGVKRGERFIVRADVETLARNPKGGRVDDCLGSHASAYLRDPQEVGPPTLEYNGLLPVPTTSLDSPPRDAYEPPATCPGGPVPAAGTLRFSSGFFAVNEAAGSPPSILITRTGGSTGAVSATFATLDGTGRAGIDYQPVLTTVHFGDGDSGTRVVEVPIIPNTLDEADRTVLIALSEPGGCATLGTPSSAVLTIEDDDPPAKTSFTVGGTVTGLAGSGLVIANFGRSQPIAANGSFQLDTPLPTGGTYRIEVTAQPQNPRQACTVTNGEGTVASADVTDVKIECATLPEPGSLDPGFGSNGRAWTAALGAPVTQEVHIAHQADGKLLVVTGGPSLLRLLPDGTPDAGFGTAGNGVVTLPTGRLDKNNLSSVAVQPDGRILVAGAGQIGAAGRFDMLVARFLADGTLDSGFAGGAGVARFDYALWNDGASQVLVQADGSILLAGTIADGTGVGSDFGVLRLTAAGQIDTGYGANGWARVNVGGGYDVPRRAALTPDGGVVLVGRVAASGGTTPDVGLAKFTSAGVPDTSFGDKGTGAVRPVTTEWDEAKDIAVLPDGRLLVAGVRASGSTGTANQLWLARYLTNGQLDTGFGSGGLAWPTIPLAGFAVVARADGAVWVAGTTPSADGSSTDFGLMRFTAAGQPDGAFNGGAVLAVDLLGGLDEGAAMLIQPDGKAVVAGRAHNGSTIGLGVLRVVP